MRKNNTHLLLASSFLFILLVFTSCGENKKQGPPPIPEITVVQVQQKDVPIYNEYVGQVYGYSDIPIRARVKGFLQGIYFKEGSKVKKGQLLYKIDPEEYEAKVATQESHLAEARTELAKSKSDLDRIKPLADINAVSQSDLDAAQANYDASLSYVEAMKSNLRFAKINLGYCRLYSPINGQIGKTKARIGEFVGQEPNPVILNTVSTVDTIRVEFFLTEADYIRLAREYVENLGQDNARAIEKDPDLQLILADGSTFKHLGHLNFVNREVDPQTGSILVQTSFPNTDRLLKPGQYAKVVVKMKMVKGALIIPQRCISELQGQYSVFVIDGDNKVNSRQIEVGETIGDMRIVKKGLKVNDKVVIDALQKIGSGLEIKPKLIEFQSKTKSLD